jgi:transposase
MVRELVRDVLKELSRSLATRQTKDGRPSIAREQLLSTLSVQVLYGIRSQRQLMGQLDENLLYRWFVGKPPDDPMWDATTVTKNCDRLQNGEVFEKFMTKLLNRPQVGPLLSDEHFGGRDLDRGVDITEELSSQGCQRRRRELPWTDLRAVEDFTRVRQRTLSLRRHE